MPYGSLPNIYEVPERPVLQVPCSEYSWVRVTFHGEKPPTRSEIFRTMELLEMMHNFWNKDEVQDAANSQSGE